MSLRRRGAMALVASTLLLAACGGGNSENDSNAGGGVTIDWWHIGTTEPTATIYDQWVQDFEEQNPGVKVNVTALENEAFKSKMTTITAGGDMPDVFSTWGGGVLAQQVEAGLVKDLDVVGGTTMDQFTEAALSPYRVNGTSYGIPVDAGMVGFWYNKALFEEAGVEETPTTWSEFLDVVQTLKDADITPIALAGKEEWPGHFYWSYLAMRVAGLDALEDAAHTNDFTHPGFVEAGERLRELAELEPFQNGYLGADYSSPDGQAALMGSGRAAMELMGQWAPSVQADAGGGIGDDLGFFPFPEVEGGEGSLDEVFGGGNGFAVSASAPKEAVDFVLFISEAEQHAAYVESGAGLPVTEEAIELVEDPDLRVVAETMAAAGGFQLYLDQAFPPAVGGQVNSSVAELFAGVATPEQVTEAITEVARAEG
ncbi:extracellular solute-binding protein [Streptomyces alkaliphilus]|uniref:Extracellular solute-binding protein n=1 Tax=Streptomyces alkaliphilus TaxID=1472722 RepID=A0A7W3Y142_9ACTN|nr:extracellular solute-binding protein [Streptomyces alkaliphilus]MBB0243927.1 extracellular solute-binding protein [Streptomyces alkaliphilus]